MDRWQVEQDRARPGWPIAENPDRPAAHDPGDDLVGSDLRRTIREVGEATLPQLLGRALPALGHAPIHGRERPAEIESELDRRPELRREPDERKIRIVELRSREKRHEPRSGPVPGNRIGHRPEGMSNPLLPAGDVRRYAEHLDRLSDRLTSRNRLHRRTVPDRPSPPVNAALAGAYVSVTGRRAMAGSRREV